jgi:hypothetical protein
LGDDLAGLSGEGMEVEFWIFSIVPLMAAAAVIDSATGLSVRLSNGHKHMGDILVHMALLLVVLMLLVLWLSSEFDLSTAFMIRYYVNPIDHAFRLDLTRWLLIADLWMISLSIAAALFLSIAQRRNVLLSVVAATLGNAGTIVWIYRRGRLQVG